jgi:predicted transcriptional regulator
MTARKTSLIKGRVDHIAEELDRCRVAYRKLQDDSLFVAKTAQDMLDIGNNKIDRLTAALEECLEYFQERQDGEYIDGKPVGNAEMRLGQMVEEALGRGGRHG